MKENKAAAGVPQWAGMGLVAMVSLSLLLAACDIGGGAAPASQAAVSQPQVAATATQAGNPPPYATAYWPNGTPVRSPVPVIPPVPALPALAGRVLLDDNFANTPISNYTIVDLGAPAYQPLSTWNVGNGRLMQQGDSYGNPADYETLALIGAADWKNYSVEVEAYSGGTPFGLVARYSKSGFYRLRVSRSAVTGAGWELARYDATRRGYKTVSLTQGAVGSGYTIGQWNYLKLTVQGSAISVTINGQAVATINDATDTAGNAGLYSEATGTYFGNLRVTALP